MLCRYNFSYTLRDRAGDVPYTLDITEYIIPPNKTTAPVESNKPNNTNTNIDKKTKIKNKVKANANKKPKK